MAYLDWTKLSIEEIIKGYQWNVEAQSYSCAICGEIFQMDEIFPHKGRWFTAEKMVQRHIQEAHPNHLNELLAVEKKYTGLTENQKELMLYMNEGLSDKEIAKKLDVTATTVRHQRFKLRERAKQAKLYLAIYELATHPKASVKQDPQAKQVEDDFVEIHSGATMVDDRYILTEEESHKIITTMFTSLNPLKLKTFDTKEKKKIVILRKIVEQLEPQKKYTEIQLNQLLKEIYPDFATLRRYLIQYGFMERTPDGKAYWLK